ncbi:hypothetical protein [Flavobacterium johnsoniae]|uniref:hypothetical protein n=1 Tax=Flavobacterium johnsoniae TaxID=986 RepID=UPI003D977C7F
MKICLISFDSTYFDHNIILELKRKNIDAHHIDASKFRYKYKSVFEKISNSIKKSLFNTNIKQEALENYILSEVKKLGHQDIIMFIRPDRVSKKTHLEIKKQSNKYITYIYDSCRRFPIDNLLDGIFDEIYSFDLIDVKKYNFNFISNYIYLDKRDLDSKINDNVFIVISIDERFDFLNKLAEYFTNHAVKFKFIAVGKKTPNNMNKNIIHLEKTLLPQDIQEDLENSKIFLDLIRHGHNGLSFRIFEALAMQRKIITTNQSISQYDFYNPNNILILDENEPININPDFFNTPYEPLSDETYNKYTIENWVKTVFKI